MFGVFMIELKLRRNIILFTQGLFSYGLFRTVCTRNCYFWTLYSKATYIRTFYIRVSLVRTSNFKPNVRISFVLRWSNIWRFFLSPFFNLMSFRAKLSTSLSKKLFKFSISFRFFSESPTSVLFVVRGCCRWRQPWLRPTQKNRGQPFSTSEPRMLEFFSGFG